jgi:hypothetical protein
MSEMYNKLFDTVRRRNLNGYPSKDDIEFMLEELTTDGELSPDEYTRLRSELVN